MECCIQVLVWMCTCSSIFLNSVHGHIPEAISWSRRQSPSGNDATVMAFDIISSDLQSNVQTDMDTRIEMSFNYTVICSNRESTLTLVIATKDANILAVENLDKPVQIFCQSGKLYQDPHTQVTPSLISTVMPATMTTEGNLYAVEDSVDVTLMSGIIGNGIIEFTLLENTMQNNVKYDVTEKMMTNNMTESVEIATLTYTVTVVRKIRIVDRLFRLVVYCVQIFVATGFGVKLDLQVVKDNLFKPVAPGIGLACQYILMPLLALTIAKLVPVGDSVVALGIFVAGCCPGGGGSNMYSYLLKGDLSLSITMTALSTILALGMLPLWIYTVGTTFTSQHDVSIPFEIVAISLSILVTPLVLGVFLRQKFPKVAKVIQKVLKPVIVVMTVVLIVVGVYSNLFIFRLFKPRIILAACLLPYAGYLLGGGVAAICRRSWKHIKTIAIETGMQNTNIAYILLINSFPAPLGDIASVAPVASAVMTPLPPFLVTIVYLTYRRCKKAYAPVQQMDDRNAETNDKDGELPNAEDGEEKEKLTVV